MKNAALFFIILFPVAIYSQSTTKINPSTNKKLDSLIINTLINDSVNKYYKNVYKAEKYLMNQKYLKAAKSYEKAFRYIDTPFAGDVSKAITCELESRKDEENIKKYIYTHINKTANKEWHLNREKYYSLSTWPEIKYMIDTINPSADTILTSYLAEILERDQSCRSGRGRQTESEIALIQETDSINYFSILELIDEYKDFSEETLGEGWSKANIILIHEPQRLEVYIKLHSQVINGKLDARKYASTLQRSYYKIEGKYRFGEDSHGTQIGKHLYALYIPSPKEKRTINKYRKSLYLEDIKSFHKKRIWQFKNEPAHSNFYTTNIEIWNDDAFNKLILEQRVAGNRKAKVYYKDNGQKKKIIEEERENKIK